MSLNVYKKKLKIFFSNSLLLDSIIRSELIVRNYEVKNVD